MEYPTPKYFQPPSLFLSSSNGDQETSALDLEANSATLVYEKPYTSTSTSKDNPFAVAETFQDPLCKLNLKETSEFVKSFPLPTTSNNLPYTTTTTLQRRRDSVSSHTRSLEAPSTPGRPLFSFTTSLPKKNFPSKWDDAEKWLISCRDSPAHSNVKSSPPPHPSSNLHKLQFQDSTHHQAEVFAEKSRVTDENFSSKVLLSSFRGSPTTPSFNGEPLPLPVSTRMLLKDKFADEVEPVLPNSRYSEPSREGFLFGNSRGSETMKDAGTEVIHEVKHRDIGTEMTPLGSSTTSRCHTPFKSTSPARHNTPANRSGPLTLANSSESATTIDISRLEECHFAKLQLGTQYDSVTSNWSSREEEEEEISKSLRHFETGIVYRKSVSDSRAAACEEEDRTKCCLRYQREEAKIQAWVNLQSAKAEAQSKKLEVKIQKMRSKLEEKLMKRMAMVHRKAEEWRAAARERHGGGGGQIMGEQLQKMMMMSRKMNPPHNLQFSGHISCGCFPCNNNNDNHR